MEHDVVGRSGLVRAVLDTSSLAPYMPGHAFLELLADGSE